MQAFRGADVALAALVDAAERQRSPERLDDVRLQRVRPGGQELADREVAVAIDDQSGEAVAFAVHETQRIGPGDERAELDRPREPLAYEIGIDRTGAAGHHADRDAGRGIPGPEAEHAAVGGSDLGGAARAPLAFGRGDRAREDPRMSGADGKVPPGFQRDAHALTSARRAPPRTQRPLLPPSLRSKRSAVISMSRSTALHMS